METLKTQLPYSGVMSSLIGGRRENQDTCGSSETDSGFLLVVCDGMGGGPAGKKASVIATQAMIDYVKTARTPEHTDATLLTDAVAAANKALRDAIAAQPELNGMGTTVAAVLINDNSATVVHVGDSRVYQMRGGSIVFRTVDHSRVGEMVLAGTLSEEQARLSAYSNIITRALGVDDAVEVDVDTRPYEKGDRFVICTDGIWGAMPQPELIKLFTKNKNSLEGTVDVLNLEVENAGKAKGGGHDNYSVIIIETKKNSILKEQMSSKVKKIIWTLGALCLASILCNVILFGTRKGGAKEEIEALKAEVACATAQRDSISDALKAANDSIATLNTRNSVLEESTKNAINTLASTVTAVQNHAAKAGKTAAAAAQVADAMGANAELKANLTALSAQIVALGKMEKGQAKADEKKRLVEALKKLETRIPAAYKAKYKNDVIGKLNASYTTDNTVAKTTGHCKSIAQTLNTIIKEIK